MTAYDPAEWSDLFVAAAGASAALAGLVFVAVSINIDRILGYEGLPERALETVLLLLGIVLVSLIGLMPGMSDAALGILLASTGVVLAAVFSHLGRRGEPHGSATRSRVLGRMVFRATGSLPYAIGGITLIAGAGGGLYWIAAGILFAIVGGVSNAWVLLVEILR